MQGVHGRLEKGSATGTMRKTKQLLKTIDLLYDAVSDWDRWPVFLESASDLFESQGAQIAHHDLQNSRVSFSLVHGYDWSTEHYEKYEAMIGEDPRIPYFNSNPFKPMHCRTYMSEEVLHDTRVYKEILSVGGVEYTLGINLLDHDQAMTYFLALRNKSQPAYGEEECELLSELYPHLHRAIKLQKELGKLDFERNATADALDGMAMGIVVLDHNLRIQYLNETAKMITAEEDGIGISGDRLKIKSDQESGIYKKIREQLKEQHNKEGKNETSGSVLISRPSGKEAYSVLISDYIPHPREALIPQTLSPYAMLLIRDLDHPHESRIEILQRLYGLTPSQAKLTNLLANGLSLKEAALQMKLTQESARQYLKLVFQKTGTSRQAELVRKVILTPKASSWRDVGFQHISFPGSALS